MFTSRCQTLRNLTLTSSKGYGRKKKGPTGIAYRVTSAKLWSMLPSYVGIAVQSNATIVPATTIATNASFRLAKDALLYILAMECTMMQP